MVPIKAVRHYAAWPNMGMTHARKIFDPQWNSTIKGPTATTEPFVLTRQTFGGISDFTVELELAASSRPVMTGKKWVLEALKRM